MGQTRHSEYISSTHFLILPALLISIGAIQRLRLLSAPHSVQSCKVIGTG